MLEADVTSFESTVEVQTELSTEDLAVVVLYCQFLEGDAPLPMVEFLFRHRGAKESHYAIHRRELGLHHSGGKPSAGDVETLQIQKSVQLFRRMAKLSATLSITELFLISHREATITFRDLWVVLSADARAQQAKGRPLLPPTTGPSDRVTTEDGF